MRKIIRSAVVFLFLFFIFSERGQWAYSSSQPAAPQEEKAEKKPVFNIEAAEHLQFSAENLTKKGLKVKASAKYSDDEESVRAALIKEHFLDSPFFVGAELTQKREEDSRYHLRGAGEGIFAGMELSAKSKATLKFNYQEVRVKKVSADAPQILKDASGTNQISTLSLLLEHSSLDSSIYPASGSQQSLTWEQAMKILNGDYGFSRLTAQAREYLPLSRIFTLAARTKIGWSEPSSANDEIPYYEEFFCGGSGTVRGYRGKRAGPKDANNLPLGGNFLLVNNLELRFPVRDRLKGALFFDAGNVWQKPGQFEVDQFRYGAGLGLRYVTKWGVARLDYGFRLKHESGQPAGRLAASFGIQF